MHEVTVPLSYRTNLLTLKQSCLPPALDVQDPEQLTFTLSFFPAELLMTINVTKKKSVNLYPASHFKSLHAVKQHRSLNQDDLCASGSPLSLVPCSSQQSSQQSSLQSSHEDDATRFLSPLIREER